MSIGLLSHLKNLLPDREVPMRIWRGPFRGARIVLNPRASMRKVFGLYEHELNAWLEVAIGRVSRALDIGANDGYFTFGIAAAFRRLGVRGEVIAFEPDLNRVKVLRSSIDSQGNSGTRIEIVHAHAGGYVRDTVTMLDALPANDRQNTLIKIDVEGEELDVIAGAGSWLHPSNLFMIEVHKEEYLDQLRRTFSERGLKLVQVNQQSLPFLGREQRDAANWWLVSDLAGPT